MPFTFCNRTVLHFRTLYRILCTNKLKVLNCLIDLRNTYNTYYFDIHNDTFLKNLAYTVHVQNI